MREEITFIGGKPVSDRRREILARGHAMAKRMFGANYQAAVEPICEELRSLIADAGCDALTVGSDLVEEMNRIGGLSACSKAITLAAIYEVDKQELVKCN